MIKAFFVVDVHVHDPRKIEENVQIIGDDNYKICFLSLFPTTETIYL